ncbi:MAG: PASTA domain-containing protein, partial [Actinobacteria bacterium]|nr:PASTA domain-containing protein [Actinomycetota bacterium]
GCVLYEMLTGSSPFTGDTPLSIAYKHVREHARPPSSHNPDVPAPLEAVTMKALAKNPDNRYTSAAEMAEDLDRFTKGERVRATPLLGGETRVATAVGSGTQVLGRDELALEEDETKSRAGWYALLAVAILALFGLLAWWLATNVLGGDVRVPNLVGLEVNAARDRLEDSNLQADVKKRFSDAPVDEVIEQDPEAGEMVDENETITLFVSRGPRKVEVPGVVGSTLQEARNELRRSDLRVGPVSREPSSEPQGTVLRQDPTEGEEVDEGTRVALVISAGPEPATVPFVVGLREDQAIAAIEGAGLDPEVRRETDDAPEGEVTAQEPPGGTEVEPGDTVVITVSEGPEKRKMPDVRGDDADSAEEQLEDEYGLDVTQEQAEESCTQPPGTVCDQDPKPGRPVLEGDEATLFVEPELDAAIGSPFIAVMALYTYLF